MTIQELFKTALTKVIPAVSKPLNGEHLATKTFFIPKKVTVKDMINIPNTSVYFAVFSPHSIWRCPWKPGSADQTFSQQVLQRAGAQSVSKKQMFEEYTSATQ